MKRWTSSTAAVFLAGLCLAAQAQGEASLKETMDRVVERLYRTMDEAALDRLDHESALALFGEGERDVLATGYWRFAVNVPVTVSVVRNVDQQVTPFWLAEAGFEKTPLEVKNEIWTYEVWRKDFEAGRVELGINGLGKHRVVYYVGVEPQEPGADLSITDCYPPDEAIIPMREGAWTYRDWNELVIEELPAELEDNLLLTTFRGRAREAHLVGAFRKTPHPSSPVPDHIALTWSGDPATTQTVQWRTAHGVDRGVVRYWPAGREDAKVEVAAETEVIEDRLLMNDRRSNRMTAELRGLSPGVTYQYTVGSPDSGAWSAPAAFTTAPAGGNPVTRFIYFGDTHKSAEWGDVLTKAHARHPENAFYLIGGDLVSTGLHRDDWDVFQELSSGVFREKPLMFSLGNHDDQDGLGPWMPLALYAFPHNGPAELSPERTYTFRHGHVRFFMLDVGSPHAVQARWLEKELAASDAPWNIGVYHFPLYSFPEDAEYEHIRREWEAVFARKPLDLMLSGHVHYYLRTKPMRQGEVVEDPALGTIHISSLGTRGRVEDREPPAFTAHYNSGGLWYQTFEATAEELRYQARTADGSVFDSFTLNK